VSGSRELQDTFSHPERNRPTDAAPTTRPSHCKQLAHEGSCPKSARLCLVAVLTLAAAVAESAFLRLRVPASAQACFCARMRFRLRALRPRVEFSAEALAVLRALLVSLKSSSEADGRLGAGALSGLARLTSDTTFAEWFDKAAAHADGDANARAIVALREEWLRTLTDARSAYLR